MADREGVTRSLFQALGEALLVDPIDPQDESDLRVLQDDLRRVSKRWDDYSRS